MKTLNKIGGKHGVGRVDMVENRYVGMKSRGVYETPGGAILHFAHGRWKASPWTGSHAPAGLAHSEVRGVVYYGYWFAPERYALQALVTESQKNVTGTVRVKLYKGNIMVAGRKSPVSLYNPHIATMEADPTKAYTRTTHRLHPAECAAPESRSQGAEEEISRAVGRAPRGIIVKFDPRENCD